MKLLKNKAIKYINRTDVIILMQSAGIDLSAVIAAACRYLGIEEKELARPTRRVEIARSRALISYVDTQIMSISGSEVARRFNVDRSAISRVDPKGKPRPKAACNYQNDTERTRTRNESTLKQRPAYPPLPCPTSLIV